MSAGPSSRDTPEVASPSSPVRSAPILSGLLLSQQILRYLPGAIGPALIGLLFTSVITRLLTSAEYGRYSLALSGATFAASVASQWLAQGVYRFLPIRADSEERMRLKGGVALSTAIIALALGSGAAGVWGVMTSLSVLGWRDVIIAAGAYAVVTAIFLPLTALLQSEMRAGRHSAYQLMASAGRFALALALVQWVSRSATSLIWAWAIAYTSLIPFLWRNAGVPPIRWIAMRWRALAAEAGRMARYGIPMTGWVTAATLLEVGDRYVIQIVRGPSEVGIYSANYNLVVGAVALVSVPILHAAHPFLMQAWEAHDPAAAARWLETIVEWFIIMGVLLVAPIAIFARDLAFLLLGPAVREGYPVIPVVLAGVIIWQLGMYAHKPLEFAERTRLLFGFGIAAATFNILLNVAMVPVFGYRAAAYTTLASYLAYAVLVGRVGRTILPWKIRYVRIIVVLSPFLVGVVAAAVSRGIVERHFGYVAGAAMALALVTSTAGVVVARAAPALLAGRAVQ